MIWYQKPSSSTLLILLVFLFACSAQAEKASPADKQFQLGKQLVKAYQCASCHVIDGKGAEGGIKLDKLKRSQKFIAEQLMDPEEHVMRNAKAFNFEPNLMPSHQLTLNEARAMALYLATKDIQSSIKPMRFNNKATKKEKSSTKQNKI